MSDIKTEILHDVYGKDAPNAAKAGVGARSLDEIKQATNARRELSRQQSTPKTGPVRKDA